MPGDVITLCVCVCVCRFIAVTQPIHYAKHKNSRRTYIMLALTWLVSVAISLPIAVGMNYTDRRAQTPNLCTFYNAEFLIYSSMTSFYIPCVVIVLLCAECVCRECAECTVCVPCVCRHRLVVLADIPRYSQAHSTPKRRYFRSQSSATTS